ncbi:periplasmic chaperone for outer membrane proteins SurA [Thalassospira xiamenensis M-5 = DSM 17429]|uniref:Parvulin-like PPIase n=2 Tax=Thalassospira xiamenensis TaxID=220697 RepID=A0AB72UEL1_9PROT|nr:peptidyl-prolyl cis-trans isomerase [Thalassospira xiamenensis M-5 = DSM 17429]SIT23494.1 periplasmic chaperone for outer membrane proteins SurA [Thalassospira xiamenensis M-5 = DSM 17429]
MLFAAVSISTARAQSTIGVAAVVNDAPISVVDLVERIKLVAASSNIPMSPQRSQEMAPQILQQLINEKLQLQESERRGFEVTDADIDRAKTLIEQNSGLPTGGLDQFLAQNGIASETIRNQIRPQIAWQKLLGSMRREIEISDTEIDDNLERIRSNQGKPRNNVQEIFLPVDNPQDETKVYQNAREVIRALEQGANFGGLARQFSASSSAANGGNLGWLYSGEMAGELQQAINQMQPGDVSDPIRTIRGYYILKLLERRRGDANALTDVRLDLYQLFVPIAANTPQDEVNSKLGILQNAKETADSCQSLANVAVDLGSDMSGKTEGISPNDLAGPVRNAVANLDKGGISDLIKVDGGALLVMVCDKTEESTLPDRESIRQRLEMERLEILARRKLRELRRNAFIDIRM